MNESITIKDVFEIREDGKDGHGRWNLIGVGFVNRDNSINVIFDTYFDEHGTQQVKFPANGRIQIRDRKPRQEAVIS